MHYLIVLVWLATYHLGWCSENISDKRYYPWPIEYISYGIISPCVYYHDSNLKIWRIFDNNYNEIPIARQNNVFLVSLNSHFFSRHEYNRILSEINEKHAEEEEINAILQDWKLLAQKVDYILFWVFLCLTTVSSCIFIFILPYFKRGKLLWKLFIV